MATFYADENYPYPVVMRLRAMGYDVLTADEDVHHRIRESMIRMYLYGQHSLVALF